MSNRPPLLEVIACSVADAVAAEQGGADRIELIAHFEVGGLTPPLQLVEEVVAAVRMPVRVMVRANQGFEVEDGRELAALAAAAAELGRLPVDGLVLGFVRGGAIDLPAMTAVLTQAPHLSATFHRAFEVLPDRLAAIGILKTLPQIDHILSSGGERAWADKIDDLAEQAEAARPEIDLLLGGGLSAEVMPLIRSRTSIRAFHVGRAARAPATIFGRVEAAQVAALKRLLS